jgi:hypothetical protein
VHVLALALSLLFPSHGVLAPGKSLGGVRLGMTQTQVRTEWGNGFARCQGCAHETWYFNYRAFTPQGAAVRYAAGRVDAVWTLWKPPGWRTTDGLRLGVPAAQVTTRFGALVTITCGSYSALIRTKGRVTTVYYLFDEKLWGFGLSLPGAVPCH